MTAKHRNFLAPPMLACAAAYLTAGIVCFFDPRLSAIPLSLFLIVCFTAPFFPRSSFYLPVISKGSSGRRAVALTFDDGPDPNVTPAVLDLLDRYKVPATFFVAGRRVSENMVIVVRILSAGHSVGNHSYHHSPFLMLRSSGHLTGEIRRTQSLLSKFGILPCAFRPPVGITSPRLGPVLEREGLACVNYSNRARDAGNRFIHGLSSKILRKVKPDDIILLHDTAPGTRFDLNGFLAEIELILVGLKDKGLEIMPLSAIIGEPVMKERP